MRRRIPLLLTIVLLGSCARPMSAPEVAVPRGPAPPEPVPQPPVPQAVSLLGRPLFPMELDPDVRRVREHQLVEARASYEQDPRDEDTIIWLGRRLAYLGRYDLALQAFTEGLEIHPASYRLLRHRGHRWITTRRFDLAVEDLERAAALAESVPDEVEPDGLPNPQNLPRSTSHTNIYYHLGLARFLQGDYRAALEAFSRCLDYAANDDMQVATMYWVYLTLQRLDRGDAAAMLLESVAADMHVIENFAYHRLLMMFTGELSPEDLLGPEGDDAIESATTAYGVANWYFLRGEEATAVGLLRRIVDDPAWPAFGHIAAEADLARRGGR